MNRARLLPSLAAVFTALLLTPAATAQGAGAPTSTPVATTPTAPAPAPPACTPPPPGQIKLVIQKAFGKPPFVVAGGRMVVRGIVVPYVGGQKVKVSFYRDGRKVGVKTVSVLAIGNGAGQFHLGYSSASAGLVQARAVHYA